MLDCLSYVYLEYRNNFLSVEGFANYYSLPYDLAEKLIDHAREIYKLTYQ